MNNIEKIHFSTFSYMKFKVNEFLENEDGNESVELAVLFPIILLIVGFVMDRFIQYEGVTAVSSAANEAIRYSVVAENTKEATKVIQETLSDRMKSSSLGWCTNKNNSSCRQWGTSINSTNDEAKFKKDKTKQLLVKVDKKGWCNGSYITVGVRAHKSSIFPSYESFQRLIRKGGPVYHQHTYIIKARVESNKKC